MYQQQFPAGSCGKCRREVFAVRSEIMLKEEEILSDRRHRYGGWIHVIFMIKVGLLILGAWIVYQSWQEGTLEDDMTRYGNEIIDAFKSTIVSDSSDSGNPITIFEAVKDKPQLSK